MLSLKQRRVCLEYVKDPNATFTDIANKISSKGSKISPSKVSSILKGEEALIYVEQLFSQVAGSTIKKQKKILKRLSKVYKESMTKIVDANGNNKAQNLSSANSALMSMAQLSGIDKPLSAPINLTDFAKDIPQDAPNFGEQILFGIMNSYTQNKISESQLNALMRSLEVLTAMKMATKTNEMLDSLDPENNLIEGSIFDVKD